MELERLTDDILCYICVHFLTAKCICAIACANKRFNLLFKRNFWKKYSYQLCENIPQEIIPHSNEELFWKYFARILSFCPWKAFKGNSECLELSECAWTRHRVVKLVVKDFRGSKSAYFYTNCLHFHSRITVFGGQLLEAEEMEEGKKKLHWFDLCLIYAHFLRAVTSYVRGGTCSILRQCVYCMEISGSAHLVLDLDTFPGFTDETWSNTFVCKQVIGKPD